MRAPSAEPLGMIGMVIIGCGMMMVRGSALPATIKANLYQRKMTQ